MHVAAFDMQMVKHTMPIVALMRRFDLQFYLQQLDLAW